MENRMLVDFSEAPEEPLRRLMWLSGVMQEVRAELDREYQRAYFQMRLQGRLDEALGLNLHSNKRVMAFTRAENESRGRLIRWGDRRG